MEYGFFFVSVDLKDMAGNKLQSIFNTNLEANQEKIKDWPYLEIELSACLEVVPEVYSGKPFSPGKTGILEPLFGYFRC